VGSAALVAGALAAGTSVLAPFAEGFFAWGTWRSPSGPGAAWLPVAGGAALLGALHVADGLGALQARLAPRLLGTTPGEELAALRAGAEAAAERERVARELHDGVGHAVTVTLLQARAARRVLDADPEAARRSLAAIEAVSRTTMEELDRVLGLLREEAGDEPAGQPAAFDELARSLRAAGLPFELVRHGDLDALPAPVRAAAHRIVQEAATNVLRHAGAAPTRAELVVRDGRLEVCVHNVAGPRAPGRTGGGRGLRGVRERALALGGSAASGPSADGGWTVRATLPSEAP
jgi:signal transduction histidine kinase